MISSIQSNAGLHPANQAPRVSPQEVAGERENDGDADDAARSTRATLAARLPQYMGGKIDTLA
jgi:hypothetical protein